jgi:hypothetical protein
MNQITGLTDSSSQVITLPIPDGSSAVLTITYRPQQFGWFVDLTWNGNAGTFEVNGMRLTTFPNILRQYENQLPFGIWCFVTDGGEPTYPEDFVSGRVALYLLAPEDILLVEASAFP